MKHTKIKTTVTMTADNVDEAELLYTMVKAWNCGQMVKVCRNRLALIRDLRNLIARTNGEPSLIELKNVVFDHVK